MNNSDKNTGTKKITERDAADLSELLCCPFCGQVPQLPDGVGTQYVIDCSCGMASSSVQICDLMTIEERVNDKFTDYRYDATYVERAKNEAIKNWNTRF